MEIVLLVVLLGGSWFRGGCAFWGSYGVVGGLLPWFLCRDRSLAFPLPDCVWWGLRLFFLLFSGPFVSSLTPVLVVGGGVLVDRVLSVFVVDLAWLWALPWGVLVLWRL